MRDILFRGKYSKKSPDWIEGSFHRDEDTNICEIAYRYYKKENETKAGIWVYGVVDPETVGQYTGLTDKNGRKIFEGDIVKIPLYAGCQEKAIAVVAWDILCAVFYLHGKRVNTDFYHYFGNDCEIIGNIHDNPELIGGEANA